MECIEDVTSSLRLLKPSVHLVTVLQLKEEVWHRCRNPFIFCQATEFGILVEIEEMHCKQNSKHLKKLWFMYSYV